MAINPDGPRYVTPPPGVELGGLYGSTANPVRLIYAMGAIWRLAQDREGRRLEILEIGSWAGASALAFGAALALHNGARGRITCVDAWRPYHDPAANSGIAHQAMEEALAVDEVYEVFRRNMAHLPDGVACKILRGFSDAVLPTLPAGQYDLVYIDGDHAYRQVRADLANAMPLVAENGILCGDDLELQAHEIDATIARKNPTLDLAFVADRDRHYHPGVTLAVAEALGPVSAWEGFWAMRKTAGGWEPVSLDGMPFNIPPHLSPQSLMGLKAFLMERGIL